MPVLARNNLLILLLLLPACATADQASLYQSADIKQMPRGLDDLKRVKTDDRLAEIIAPISGQHRIIRYIATSSGMPLIADTASRKTVVVVFDRTSPVTGKYEVGKEILAAYLTAGPPSMPIGTYCLGMATTGFVDVKSEKPGLYNVTFDLNFSQISAADFKGVCDDEHFEKTVRNVRQIDLKRPARTKP